VLTVPLNKRLRRGSNPLSGSAPPPVGFPSSAHLESASYAPERDSKTLVIESTCIMLFSKPNL
jgi:hypothetical protein